jgi:hypothetical protein
MVFTKFFRGRRIIFRKSNKKMLKTEKVIIVAELHEDNEPMTDYFGYHTVCTVILGFSTHTKDLFPEMCKFASNFEQTAYLVVENKDYEHREKLFDGRRLLFG